VIFAASSNLSRGDYWGIAGPTIVITAAILLLLIWAASRPMRRRTTFSSRQSPNVVVVTAQRNREAELALLRARPEPKESGLGVRLESYFSIVATTDGIYLWQGRSNPYECPASFKWSEVISVLAGTRSTGGSSSLAIELQGNPPINVRFPIVQERMFSLRPANPAAVRHKASSFDALREMAKKSLT
jgi:hypothetical protein